MAAGDRWLPFGRKIYFKVAKTVTINGEVYYYLTVDGDIHGFGMQFPVSNALPYTPFFFYAEKVIVTDTVPFDGTLTGEEGDIV